MAKLKKYTIHKEICNVCNGNGYVKIREEYFSFNEEPEFEKENKEEHVHQCWECDSEGEYYVHEPKMVPSSDAGNNNSSSTQLH